MADTLNFDDYGLALGLISYSFKTDGKILFDEAFKNDLFSKHRKIIYTIKQKPPFFERETNLIISDFPLSGL